VDALSIPPGSRGPSLRHHPLDATLRLFADVREGEGGTVLLLTANVFLVLTAYYLLKVAREPLILLGGGAEVKSYASVGQSLLLIPVTGLYSWFASRVGRMPLIAWVTVFFASNLVLFWALGVRDVPLGIPFFLWVGIFNLVTVTQFWSFAADVYSEEQGKRLFPIIGIGSSFGAVAGAWIADKLFRIGAFRLMLLAGAVLMASLALTYIVNRREGLRVQRARESSEEKDKPARVEPLGGANGFSLLIHDNYLILFAIMILVLNIVTKTGDYVFDRKIIAAAHDAGQVTHAQASLFIGQYKARYFEWVNGVGLFLQLFVVSRIIKYLGLRVALVVMPLASLIGYGAAFVVPLLSVLFVARAVESGLDYSLSNTTRQALWLVTSREDKYKAKQVVDSFVVRVGDAMSAGVVWVGSHLHLELPIFVVVNIALCLAWLASAVFLGRRYNERTSQPAPGL
jgi:AAA family ATP:ADP antiporter